jgi:hypothetical protein
MFLAYFLHFEKKNKKEAYVIIFAVWMYVCPSVYV